MSEDIKVVQVSASKPSRTYVRAARMFLDEGEEIFLSGVEGAIVTVVSFFFLFLDINNANSFFSITLFGRWM